MGGESLWARRADGFYVQVGYRFLRPLQAVAKYEEFDPNGAASDLHDLRWTTLGLNWYLRENPVRLSANYVFKREATSGFPNDSLLVQFQLFLH